jgi:hypothetical protein
MGPIFGMHSPYLVSRIEENLRLEKKESAPGFGDPAHSSIRGFGPIGSRTLQLGLNLGLATMSVWQRWN